MKGNNQDTNTGENPKAYTGGKSVNKLGGGKPKKKYN
jgi:hypothetical protein